jgi:hypothetical protein
VPLQRAAKGATARCNDALQIEQLPGRLDLRDNRSPPGLQSVVIEVRPAGAPGLYVSTLDGQCLSVSRQPFVTSAWTLLRRGVAPDLMLVMRSRSSSTDALRGKLGEVAELTVIENRHAGPVIRPYRNPASECPLALRWFIKEADFDAPGREVSARAGKPPRRARQ